MDFVTFDNFTENDALPSPQPSLSIPLKSNIESLGARFTNFKDIKNLLKTDEVVNTTEGKKNDLELNVAKQYASLSLLLISKEESIASSTRGSNLSELSEQSGLKSYDFRSDALSKRLGRALKPGLSDASMRDIFCTLEYKIPEVDTLVDSGVEGSIARKSLRGNVEKDLIKSYSAALSDYVKPIGELKVLGEKVRALDNMIASTKQSLVLSLSNTEGIRDEASQLMSEKALINLKQSLLANFKAKFVLNEYELFLLDSNDINEDFFAALKRAKNISESCLILLGLDNPELGRKILAQNNELIGRAERKITQYCNKSLSNTYSLNDPNRLAKLHLCLFYVQHKPDMLRSVIEAFADSRSSALLEEFNNQVNGDSSKPHKSNAGYRPVYYSFHDPVRFITDLLAYVHTVTVNESEFITSLLKGSQDLSNTSDEVVEKILTSLAKPTKSQIDLIVSLMTKLPILYQMFDHLQMYLLMFSKIKNARKMHQAVEESLDLVRQKIFIVLINRLATIKNSNLAKLDLSPDLQPPEWIVSYYSDLIPMIDSMSSSTILDLSPEENERFLKLVVDDPIEVFNEHLKLISGTLSKTDASLCTLNFLDFVILRIMPITLLSDKMIEVSHMINDITTELKNSQFQSLLADCKLSDYYNISNMICPLDDDGADDEIFDASLFEAITENKLFTKERISEVNAIVQGALPTSLMDLQLALMKLNNPIIVNDIISTSSTRFLRFYKHFSAIVLSNLHEELLTWTENEVATLLGVEG